MSRATTLLVALGAVVVLVVWYLLLWSPRVETLETIAADLETTQGEQAVTQSRIADLQLVREQAPDVQDELTAAAAVLPDETALPSALRQLQQAAADSGATLVSVAPGRPTDPVEGTTSLYGLTLTIELRGAYFQIVDTLRRLEDPTISPRGFVWDNVAISVEEYPSLTVAVNGRMFADLPAAPAPAAPGADPAVAEDAPEGEPTDAETSTEPTADAVPSDASPATEPPA
jgi:hypothetical protein